jgi:hypothetical protein
MGKKEIVVLLIIGLILSSSYVLNATPMKAVHNRFKAEPMEIIQIPELQKYNLAIVKPDGYGSIRVLVLAKDWLWWKVEEIFVPGEFRRQKDGELVSQSSTHYSYITVLGLPDRINPVYWAIVGETTENVQSVVLEYGNAKQEFETIPYGLTRYFYFIVPADGFLPENMHSTLSIKLDDQRQVYYPFIAD